MFVQAYNGSTSAMLAIWINLLMAVYIVFNLINNLRKNYRLPPGPYGLPIFGYLPFIQYVSHTTLNEIAKKFGDIYSITLGNKTMVVLSDPLLIREAYNRIEFTGRPKSQLYCVFNGYGVINTAGSMWREERKNLIHQFLKPAQTISIEQIIKTETEYLLNDILKGNGNPMDLDHNLTAMSTNVITSFMVSKRYNSDDEIFASHKKINSEGFELFAKLDRLNYNDGWLFHPTIRRNLKTLKEYHQVSTQYFRNIVRERQKNYKPGDANDVLDTYLALFHRRGYIPDFEDQVVQVLCDLVSAGGESTKTTLLWAIIYLVYHPNVHEKMKEEIDRVVGNERLPSIEDKPYMVYSHAVMNEVLRISNVVPVAPFHATEKEVQLRGYTIPKNTIIAAVLYNCHTSSKYWDSPEEFQPERFIKDGKITNPKQFMPFGKGLRACLGDTLAINELFIVLTSLVQNMDISLPPNTEMPSLEGVCGVTLRPVNYNVCLTPRENSYFKLSRGI